MPNPIDHGDEQGGATTRSFRQRCYERWSRVHEFLHGLKVAWVSVGSVVVGALLFLMAPQVQDLFLEVTGDHARTVVFWLLFCLSVMVAWGLPVYVSSRWILSRFEQGPAAHAFPNVEPVQTWVRRGLPPLLAVGCFVAVLIGQLLELTNAPALVGEREATTGQSLWDVLLKTTSSMSETVGSGTMILIIYGIIVAVVSWFFVHRWIASWSFRAARISGKIVWWTIAVIAILPVLVLLLGAPQFVAREWTDNLGLGHLAILPGLTLAAAYLTWRGLRPSRHHIATPIGRVLLRWRGIGGAADEAAASREIVVPLYYLALGASLALIAITVAFHPVHITEYLYRAPLLPVLLGLLVAPLTYLTSWSLRLRAPLVLAGILVAALFVFVTGDSNDVRTVPASSSRESLKAAVSRWAAVNDCSVATTESARTCPSPFIISVAGGASRSAFHVAGVIGRIMDDTSLIIQTGYTWPEFSRDGSRIVTMGSGDKPPSLWDTRTGQEIAALKGDSATFSPDGMRIVTTAYGDNTAWLWEGATGQSIAVLKQQQGAVQSATFSPDGARILTIASGDNSAWLWDGKTGQAVTALTGERPVTSATFSPDGARIVTIASGDRIPRLWDGRTGQEIAVHEAHVGAVEGATFSPDGSRLITIAYGAPLYEDKTARLWHALTGQEIAALTGHEGIVRHVVFSPDGARVVTLSNEEKAPPLWNAETGKLIAALKGREGVRRATFSPDGARIVTIANGDNTPSLWDGKTGDKIATLTGHEEPVHDVLFSPDGARILTFAWGQRIHKVDKRPRLWNARTGQAIATLDGEWKDPVQSATFSPDGTRLITTTFGDTAWLWDGETGEPVAALNSGQGSVEDAAFSPDGTRIVTNGDNTPWLWDGKTGDKIAALTGHEEPVRRAIYSPNGERIVTTSVDGTMGVWDGQSGSNIVLLAGSSQTLLLRPFAKQLFAVSGVSGGALGAVVTYAALADSQNADRATNGIGNPPCKKGVADTDWFAPYVKINRLGSGSMPTKPPDAAPVISPLDAEKSWRGCLQLLLAGDFISPVMVSFGSADRASILEEAWEMRYAKLTGQDESDSTLGKPLVALRKDALKDEKNWLPILLLNATSVTTGRRIVTTDVDTLLWQNGKVTSRVFTDAYDLHELFRHLINPSDIYAPSTPLLENRDVRLSTAASISARFPIISPQGNLRDADGRVIDRVVDGGYFENFGASTATEIAGELTRLGLKPFIILVNNEPTTSGIACIAGNGDSTLSYPTTAQTAWFAWLRAPLNAVLATRQARGSYAAANLCSWISDQARFAFISIGLDTTNPNKALSMSWWLSKNVQKYLNEQLDINVYNGPDNASSFRKINAARKTSQRLTGAP